MEMLHQALIYLIAAVVAVPLAQRVGFGSVLGYLLAGIVIGPILGFVGDEAKEVKHFAEFGVVMMLFLVGLELKPSALWQMRRSLIGLGGVQVVGTSAVLTGIGVFLGLEWQAALACGMILSLSSTAIVLQTHSEKGWSKMPAGESAFSVLLFQDIAVIPMFSLLPLLAVAGGGLVGDAAHAPSFIHQLPVFWRSTLTLGVMLAIVFIGKYLNQYIFRFISAARLREIFTAMSLLIVLLIASIMDQLGLSPALGAFMAGVVLSESEYRHELESDIAPFKGLLLGLFFISVGASIDFSLLKEQAGVIAGLAFSIMFIKFLFLIGLSKKYGLNKEARWLFALSLCQAGEFGFVLFNFSAANGVLDYSTTSLLNLVVTITMMLTPVLFIFYESLLMPRFNQGDDKQADEIDEKGTVVLAGVGRFGQITSRILMSSGYKVTLLDHSASLVELMRKVGIKTYFGDATRPDLLEAAGIKEAKLFVAAMDDKEKQLETIKLVRRTNPDIKILARAYDRPHVYELKEAGADIVERELFEAALQVGESSLVALGEHPFKAKRRCQAFKKHDITLLESLQVIWNKEKMSTDYIKVVRAKQKELFDLMSKDHADPHSKQERGWDAPH